MSSDEASSAGTGSHGGGIDAARLRAFLRAQLPEAREISLSDIELASGGLSREHYVFDLRWSDAEAERCWPLILIRNGDRPGQTDRGREFRLLRALDATAVPVPKVHWCDETGDWLTRPFLVMERVGGAATPPFEQVHPDSPELRQRVAEQFVDILADLHRLDWRALGLDGLGVPPGAPSEQAKNALAGLTQALDALGARELDPIIDRALDWLRAHTPRTERLALCHGDYKPDNILLEDGRILAVVDWERASIGDPMADLAYTCVPHLRVGELAVGLAPPEQIVARYGERSGLRVDPTALAFWQLQLTLATVLYFHALIADARQRGEPGPSPLQALIDHLLRLIGPMLD